MRFRAVTRCYVTLLCFVGLCQLSVFILFNHFHVPAHLQIGNASLLLLIVYVLSTALMVCFYVLWKLFSQRDNPLFRVGEVLNGLWRHYGSGCFIFEVIAFLIVFSVFSNLVDQCRSMIGFIVPFYLDPYLLHAQKILFFNASSWSVMSTLLSPVLVYTLNIVYASWGVVIFYFFCFVSYQQFQMKKIKFLVSFLLTWFVVGVVCALLLSSCGPCFYTHFYSHPIPGLQSYLNQLKSIESLGWGIESHQVQQSLLREFQTANWASFSGITAAPSLHVGCIFLLYFYVREFYCRWANLFLVYAVWVWMATVVLAWHTIIDGAIACILVKVIYAFSGWLCQRPWFFCTDRTL